MRNGFMESGGGRAWIAAVSALAALALVALAAPAKAVVMYSYTGNNFNVFSNETPPTGTYDTSMSVTGTFTVAAPLVSFSGSISPLSYSFNDGRNTLDDANSSVFTFLMSTDAGGAPLLWQISIDTAVPPTAVGDQELAIATENSSVFVSDTGSILSCISASSGTCTDFNFDRGSIQNSAGSWTVASVAVPEPSSLALVLVGLSLLGGFARRRPAARRA